MLPSNAQELQHWQQVLKQSNAKHASNLRYIGVELFCFSKDFPVFFLPAAAKAVMQSKSELFRCLLPKLQSVSHFAPGAAFKITLSLPLLLMNKSKPSHRVSTPITYASPVPMAPDMPASMLTHGRYRETVALLGHVTMKNIHEKPTCFLVMHRNLDFYFLLFSALFIYFFFLGGGSFWNSVPFQLAH